MTAIFGAMVFVNRQTAGFLQEVLVYIYPLPLAIYAARYGVKTGLIAAAAMTGLSLFLGTTPAYAFYAITSLLTGLALGGCLYHKASAGKTLFAVMGISVLAYAMQLIFSVQLTGISVDEDLVHLQSEFRKPVDRYLDTLWKATEDAKLSSVDAMRFKEAVIQMIRTADQLFDTEFLKKILVLGVIIFGMLQGFLIYELSLLIMRRLRIRVPEPINVNEIRPPAWTGYIALLFCIFGILCLYGKTDVGQYKDIALVLFYAGLMLLVIFGIIGTNILLRNHMPGSRFLPVIISFIGLFVCPYVIMIIGFLYISKLTGLFPDPVPKTNDRGKQMQNNVQESSSLHPAVDPQNFRPDYLILVNDYRAIPEGYDEAIKPFLTEYTEEVTGKHHFVEKRTLQAFLDLRDVLLEDGVTVAMAGCYRSVARQQEIVDSYMGKYGADYVRRYVARPGYSEHHTGLALDLYLVKDGVPVKENAETMKETELWRRVHGRISGFGFILRYPEGKEKVTGIAYEPWHLRFVGEATAQRMAWHELTLEEYLEKTPK